MADFKSILAGTLGAVNQGFDTAVNDLAEVVESLDEAVKTTSGCNFAVGYLTDGESPRGAIFRVFFDPDTEDFDMRTVTIGHFLVPHKGYPIKLGTYRKVSDDFKPVLSFDDRESLEAHFARQLSDPDSSLIQAIGFGMRKSKAEGVDDDEVPF